MARGRGRGRKLVIQTDFVVADGGRSSGIRSKHDRDEGSDPEMMNDHVFGDDQALNMKISEMNPKGKQFVNEVLIVDESMEIAKSKVNLVNESLGVNNSFSKPWNSLFTDNRIKEKGSELQFITPSVSNGHRVVRFHSDEVIQEESRWRNSLVGCVYGLQPRLERFNAFVHARWKKYDVQTVSRINSDLFLIQFADEETCEEVLQSGPYTFDNHPVVLKKWQPRMCMDVAVTALPIWIQFPGLPLEFWSINMLSKIGSVYGKPLYCDKCTISKMKLGFARILVEMDSSRDFPEMVELVDEQGMVFQQKVIYEWKPSICSNCRKFGHLKQECSDGQQRRGIWRLKSIPVQAVEGSDIKFAQRMEAQITNNGQDTNPKSSNSNLAHGPMEGIWKEIIKGKTMGYNSHT